MIGSFSVYIDRSDLQQHLNSHCLLISEFKQFLEPFKFPLFLDKFIGALRCQVFSVGGARSSLENLQVYFHPPDSFFIKIVVKGSEDIISTSYTLTITDILAFPVTNQTLLTTERLEISLLLPSDELKIIDFLRDPDVWNMRGLRYSPIENIHSIYQNHYDSVPWYNYYFALRTRISSQPIGFIGFYQLSRPDLITPVISQTPYEPVKLSYGLSKTYWGQGIMSEALAVCVPWFVKSQTVRELVGFAEVNNHGSRRLLQKLGLQDYGLLEDSMFSAEEKNMSRFVVYKSG
jgi:RimJ/RimL family protein N-acetyltransferase